MELSSSSRQHLINHASLTTDDLTQIHQCRRPHNRLGFAYQLGFVRLLNRFPAPHPFEHLPELLTYIGVQLDLDSDLIQQYTQRQQTISQHQARLRQYLQLRPFGYEERTYLARFLLEEAYRLEQPAALQARAEQFLRDQQILQPADSTLRRIVGEQRQVARQHIFHRITTTLPNIITELDGLLAVDDSPMSVLQFLKAPPGEPSATSLLRLTQKLERIRAFGILEVDLSWLNNNYQRVLARHARHGSVYRLRELEPQHRYAVLTCFLWQTYQDTIDQLIDMYDKLITKVYASAQADVDTALQQHRREIHQSLSLLKTIASILLDERVEDARIREHLFGQVSKETLASQIEACDALTTGKHSHVFYRVLHRYTQLRKFTPAFLEQITLEPEHADMDGVLAAIELLRILNRENKRKLPDDAPMDFLPAQLRPFVTQDGIFNKPAWECALLTQLRDDIKAGNIAVVHSKRFGRFDRFFIPNAQWQAMRDEFFQQAGLPVCPTEACRYLTERLDQAYDRFLVAQKENTYVQITEEGWRLSTDASERLDADTETRLSRLKQWLTQHMRSIKLPDLLIEVDNALQFTQPFLPPALQQSRSVDEVCTILATIMAYGCNIGPYTMAQLTEGVSYDQINRVTEWFLTDEAQRTALARVVNAIATLDTTQVWGQGATSSSDGQRFALPRKVLQRTYSHQARDYALEFYSFIADNYAPFYSTLIECTDRDAAYVLDGLLYNESDLPLEEHYTDTHGYTEVNFAAFAMLGKRFCPRIRGVHHQRIYRIDPNREYGVLQPLVNRSDRTIHQEWIAEYWDRMGQFYASLASGHTTASVALKRLVALSGKNQFYRANREVGRIFKTDFILQYMSIPALRRQIRRGLLKLDQLHALARDVCYAKRGQLKARDLDAQMSTCSCLTLILACIIYWQATEIERVIQTCQPDAAGVDLALLEHVSPIEWENVVLYGEYVLNRQLIR